MTNRIELNWNLEGLVDEQRYYCSETPIDPKNLPAPKAVLPGDVRTYVDTDIDVGKTYYVRIGSVKNVVEKLSAEQSIYASNIDLNYKVKLLIRNNSLIDNGYSQLGWTENGAITYNANNEISFDDNAYLRSVNIFEFNANWKIEFDFPDTKLKSDFLIDSAIFPESNFFSLGINTRCFFVEEAFL